MQPLDPLTLSLQGHQLIEASAGTGKTFTIGLLYLRLLLEQELAVHEILVVTFTNNATDELRSRIRRRIREALDILEGREHDTADTLLLDLLADAGADTLKRRNILEDALTSMDDAAIFTIHGFCQRILQENAFESNAPFEIDFLESEQSLRLMVMEDFWRQTFYSASPQKTAWAANKWKHPAGLLESIAMAISRIGAQCIPTVDSAVLKNIQLETVSCFQKLCKSWPEAIDMVTSIFQQPNCLSKNKTTGYSDQRVQTALEGMNRLSVCPEMPWLLPPCVHLLASSVMADNLIGKRIQPEHAFFTLFDIFFQLHTEFINQSGFHIQQQALAFLFSAMDSYKRTHSKMYFNDLLTRLHSALQKKNGEGVQLAKTISSRFPVALVDEFQDTDPLQYAIFQNIYSQNGRNGLFMIGDPKQAIYSFRGADIFTYMLARRNTAERNRYTMDTNYRASSAMVQGVNTLFHTNAPFIFDQDIHFSPVRAGGTADSQPLTIDGHTESPFQCLFLPTEKYSLAGKPINKENARTAAAELNSFTIAQLLNKGKHQQALLGTTPLRAGDIAVLVRTHREAAIMQQALSKLGITSVYYSQDSVYASQEALQLFHVLTALAKPGDDAGIRRCLLTDFFGMNANSLNSLQKQQQQWEELLITLQEYRTCWKKQGFMPMLQQLLIGRESVTRILGQENGERKLTNILHLAELLQEASARQTGIEGLLRYLGEQIKNPDTDAANQQLRLESDENLVRIVTIHKAKGMEYPLVFLPFIWNSRPITAKDTISFHDPVNGSYIIDLGTEKKENILLADKERLAEELRLLYVAVTRAQHCCYFCWGQISSIEKSAMAYLIKNHQDEEVFLEQALTKTFNQNRQLLELINLPDNLTNTFLHENQPTAQPTVRKFRSQIKRDWRITSYSQLISSHFVSQIDKTDQEIQKPALLLSHTEFSAFTFPKGPAAGICLHGILEELDFVQCAGDSQKNIVQTHLKRSGFHEEWTGPLWNWLCNILSTGLDRKTDFCLNTIQRKDRLDELGFHFSIQDLRISTFNTLLAQHNIEPIQSSLTSVQGLMKGFIDLVFRWGNKYYIADYKSNYLGNELNNYKKESLAKAMMEHRYDIQYLIYTVALHRYLKKRIPDYDYTRHFGGIFYLFLRGMSVHAGTDCGIFTDRPSFQLIKSLDFYFQNLEENK